MAPGTARASYSCPKTQEFVERVTARHPELAKIGIHAQPKGFDHSFRIASNLRDIIGDADDPEDLTAVRDDRAVVLLAGEDHDEWNVTLPLHAAGSRSPVGAAGILFKKGAADDARDAQAKAEIVRDEIEKGMPYEKGTWR